MDAEGEQPAGEVVAVDTDRGPRVPGSQTGRYRAGRDEDREDEPGQRAGVEGVWGAGHLVGEPAAVAAPSGSGKCRDHGRRVVEDPLRVPAGVQPGDPPGPLQYGPDGIEVDQPLEGLASLVPQAFQPVTPIGALAYPRAEPPPGRVRRDGPGRQVRVVYPYPLGELREVHPYRLPGRGYPARAEQAECRRPPGRVRRRPYRGEARHEIRVAPPVPGIGELLPEPGQVLAEQQARVGARHGSPGRADSPRTSIGNATTVVSGPASRSHASMPSQAPGAPSHR